MHRIIPTVAQAVTYLLCLSSLSSAPGQEPASVLLGHQGTTISVAWNHDGTRLASGGIDKTTRIWDPATGKTIRTLSGHTNYVYCVDSRVWAGGPTVTSLQVLAATTRQSPGLSRRESRSALSRAIPSGLNALSGVLMQAHLPPGVRTRQRKSGMRRPARPSPPFVDTLIR